MPKVTDIAYGRIASPDLDIQEEFLTHFGMTRSARTDTAPSSRPACPSARVPMPAPAPAPLPQPR